MQRYTVRSWQSRVMLAATIAVGSAALDGCASLNNKERGAIIGAASGAAAGGAIGSKNGGTARGAIIGAVVGGTAGAVIGHQMDQRAKELQQNIKNARVERVGEGILVTFDSGLLFDFNSDVLREPARANLRELAASFTKYPDTDLMIVGHTDAVGDDAYNQRLSERRANNVANAMARMGVPRQSMAVGGRGENDNRVPTADGVREPQNRRVEIVFP